MMIAPSDNIARTSIESHAPEDTFTVGITGDLEGEALARAFEKLGCTVEPEPFNLQIRVTTPASEVKSPRLVA